MHIMLMDLGPSRRERFRHISCLATLFQKSANFAPLVLCREDSALLSFAKEAGMPTLTVGTGFSNRISLRLRLNWRLRNNAEPWILQCFDPTSFNMALGIAHKKDHVNVVYTALDSDLSGVKKLEEKLHLVGAVITATREITDRLEEKGFFRSRMFPVYSCIDPAEYQKRVPRNDGRIIFACSDNLEPGYGYDVLMQALAHLYNNPKMPPWELRIAGGGPLFDEVLALADELGVKGRISIFGNEHGADILKDCDILIAPAGQQHSGLAIKEGWATGLPVICSDFASNIELIRDGVNALMFERGNAESMAEKMIALAQDEALRLQLVKAGAAELARYNCDLMLKKHIEVFGRISREYNVLESANI